MARKAVAVFYFETTAYPYVAESGHRQAGRLGFFWSIHRQPILHFVCLGIENVPFRQQVPLAPWARLSIVPIQSDFFSPPVRRSTTSLILLLFPCHAGPNSAPAACSLQHPVNGRPPGLVISPPLLAAVSILFFQDHGRVSVVLVSPGVGTQQYMYQWRHVGVSGPGRRTSIWASNKMRAYTVRWGVLFPHQSDIDATHKTPILAYGPP
ncbi:hypothetical protein N658DRAFT_153662 [Parathielavia hyrcaniae]|uniref:Uncharacterized protein n=1 Tax=Parathielavia hyrcaniae TaxID=113614 RepID=A0AAN6PXR8_9PEZI|nr:hypothetical protein N658DRAFT_153662 [Parathielavia hyrcaniae]